MPPPSLVEEETTAEEFADVNYWKPATPTLAELEASGGRFR